MRYIKQDHDYNKKILFNAQGFPYFCVNDGLKQMFYEAIQYFVLRFGADTDMDFQRRKQKFRNICGCVILLIGT